MNKKFPPASTVRRIVRHLENDLGLSVYGDFRDLDTGKRLGGCLDYEASSIMKLRKLVRTGKVVIS